MNKGLTNLIGIFGVAFVLSSCGNLNWDKHPRSNNIDGGVNQNDDTVVSLNTDDGDPLAPSSEKDILTFFIGDVKGSINGKSITVMLPYGTSPEDIEELIPTITVSAEATVNPESGVATDFTSYVFYTVTAEDGSSQVYTVTVRVSEPSRDTDILTFSIPDQIGASVINDVDHTVSVNMPEEASLLDLLPTITVSPGATIRPLSETSHAFTEPVTYTVTAQDDTTTQDWTVTVTALVAGNIVGFTADSVTLNMAYVPGGLTFPKGSNNHGVILHTVNTPYWIGQMEVTYELWNTVYVWATSVARGENIYHFANAGVKGSTGTGSVQQPVTTVNWRDAMVFSNALTEWHNAKNGAEEADYDFVYKTIGGVPIRDSRDSNATQCDAATPDPIANGFRLPSNEEWFLAASYIGTVAPVVEPLATDVKQTTISGRVYYWTPLDYTSGATDYVYSAETGSPHPYGPNPDQTASHLVAWYKTTATNTQAVGLLHKNALNLYDMSGNVWEWVFDASGGSRVFCGGAWDGSGGTWNSGSTMFLRLGHGTGNAPSVERSDLGFRLSRTIL